MTYSLKDVIDIPGLQRLMENFYAATGIPGSVLDAGENILVATGWQEICTRFHRVHPVTLQRCLESDAHIKSLLGAEGYAQYRCKNGMWDLAVPIVIAGEHVATLFLGQFFYEDESPDLAFFQAQCEECGFDEKAYLAAFARVPVFSRDKVRAIMDYYVSLVDFLVAKGLAHLREMEAERSLRQSDVRLRNVFEHSSDLIGIANPDGTIRFVSPSCERMLGYHPEELVGKNMMEVVHPEDLPLTMGTFSLLASEPWSSATLVNRLQRRDGSTIWVESIGRNLFADPLVGGLVINARDITERKHAEDALRASEARYQDIFNTAPVSLWNEDFSGVKLLLADLKAAGVTEFRAYLDKHPEAVSRALEMVRVLDVNETTLVLYKVERKDDILGALDLIFLPESTATFKEVLIAIAEGQRYFEAESVNRRLDGETINVIIRIAIPTEEEDFGNLLICVSDVTEQKRAREEIEILHTNLAARAVELEVANNELEAFSYSLSHDLKNPLTVIQGVANYLATTTAAKLDEKETNYLLTILDGCVKIDGLLVAMLRLSRVGRSELTLQETDLSELARKIALGLRMEEQERRVEFVITSGLNAWGDPNLLSVMLENLLGNAWKYTRRVASPCIEFGTKQSGKTPVFFVRDNGPGFEMQQADKLFQVFQRLYRDGEFEGSGIGLATVQRIIQRHCGRVWAESEPGKGATFFFTLPEPRQGDEQTVPPEQAETSPLFPEIS
jgi:PAS domain S-box-containing protein